MQTSRQARRDLRLSQKVGMAAAITGLILAPLTANAAPSQEDVDNAKSAENLAAMSVAQLEVQLASVRASADSATINAQAAGEALNQANIALDEAKETAEKAKQDAEKAQADYDEGRAQLAVVAQTAYQNGGSSLDNLAPYLTSDGLESLETKQNAVSSFGTAADAQIQKVAALKQVADVMAESASKAQAEVETAAKAAEEQAATSQQAADDAQAVQANSEAQYQAALEELATKKGTTVEVEQEYQESIEAQRQEAARQAFIDSSSNSGSNSSGSSSSGSSNSGSSGNASSNSSGSTSSNSSGSSNSGSSTNNGSSGSGTSGGSVNAPSSSSGASQAISFAYSVLGAPYVWAGVGPGYDCSGLVTMAYRSAGIYLSHYSQSQYYETTPVSFSSAQPGDLVFWSNNGSASGIYHVAIYLGNSQIIEAPTFGVPVRVTSIYTWGNVLSTVGRVG